MPGSRESSKQRHSHGAQGVVLKCLDVARQTITTTLISLVIERFRVRPRQAEDSSCHAYARFPLVHLQPVADCHDGHSHARAFLRGKVPYRRRKNSAHAGMAKSPE